MFAWGEALDCAYPSGQHPEIIAAASSMTEKTFGHGAAANIPCAYEQNRLHALFQFLNLFGGAAIVNAKSPIWTAGFTPAATTTLKGTALLDHSQAFEQVESTRQDWIRNSRLRGRGTAWRC